MKNSKGFGDWIEVFRGGKQIDSLGREQDGDQLIDQAVATFNANEHEPPVVVGHPIDTAPAFGWVEGLKTTAKNGVKVLLAKCRQVVPEFEDAVRKGLYKKRSASFYPDGRLRHVGFLGAAPPAVKALADLKFGENDQAITFDFYDAGMSAIGNIFRKLRDWLIEKEGIEKADSIIPDWDVEYIREKANEPVTQITQTGQGASPAFSGGGTVTDHWDHQGEPGPRQREGIMTFKERIKNLLSFVGVDVSKVPDDAIPDGPPGDNLRSQISNLRFSEAELEAAAQSARDAAKKEGRKEAEAEFAEKERTRAQQAREAEISAWHDQGLKDGKILPAWAKMGLKEFMLRLDADEVIAFSEESKASSYAWFKNFMAELPKVVEFEEVATRGQDTGAAGAGEKLTQLANKKMDNNKGLTFNEAFSQVQKENAALAAEYAQEIHPA